MPTKMDTFMDIVEKQVGKPYVWGADGPDSFDCSGLIVYAFRKMSIIKQTEDFGSEALIMRTDDISLEEAYLTRGAFLHFPGHIAISMGDGKRTIEARNPKVGVNYFDNITKRGFTRAGIHPALKGDEVAYDGKMASPVVGTVSCEWRGYKNHAGIDIACNTGTPVYAAYAGTVALAGTNIVSGRTGNGILIKNPDTERQYYGHLSVIKVAVGQKVAQGELIGLSGATGNVTGPHLHFETWNKAGYDTNPRAHFNSHGVVPGSSTGQNKSGSAASKTTSSSFLPLAIDGDELHRTITEEERALKAAGFYKGIIEADLGETAVRGPMLKEAEQLWLAARGEYTREVDGDFGVESVKAEQRQLRKLGHYSQSIDGNKRVVDGSRGAWTIKGLQAALNAKAVK